MAGPKKAKVTAAKKSSAPRDTDQYETLRQSPVSSGKSSTPQPIKGFDGNASKSPQPDPRTAERNEDDLLNERTLKRVDMGVAAWAAASHVSANSH